MTEQEHNNVQWKKVKLGDCLSIGNGCDYKHLKEGDIPVFGTGGIMTYVDNYLYDGETVCIGRKGTINHPMYHIGKIWTVDTLFYTHSFVDVIPKFIYYAFCNIDWNKYNEATGVPSLSKETIYKIEIPVPDLSAQCRIAAILASADKVIAATQKTIAKYKQIKQGMMEDLLNEQCTMNNVQWVQKTLIELADYHNGMAFKPSDWANDGVKIIRIEQLNNPLGKYDYYQGMFPETSAIHNGDLIFSWSATLKVVIWQWGDGVLNQHLFKVVPASNVDKHFLYYLLDYNMPKLGESSHGSTMKHIKRKELETHTVYIPRKIAEQKRISEILSGIDAKIAAEEKVLQKYEKVKKGLMERLLNEQ